LQVTSKIEVIGQHKPLLVSIKLKEKYMFEFGSKKADSLIKNLKEWEFERHFTWNVASVFWFLAFFFAGISLYVFLSQVNPSEFSVQAEVVLVSPLLLLLITIPLSRWEAVFLLYVAIIVGSTLELGAYWWAFVGSSLIGGIGLMFQIAKEWERAIILRLGKFKKVKGPGIFLVIPFIDTVVKKVDLRIRVTDFSAETTLTRDSAPITVDALCFWLVWDAEKAVLEVENYVDAVVLSSQAALRAAISSNDLSTLLSDGEKIEEHMRKTVDHKTTEWGITIQHIEITQIEIPAELQEAMSHIAQAEREKRAHILLSEAEVEIAARLEEASRVYKDNPVALSLKKLSVLQEGFKNGNAMIVTPSELPGELGAEDVFGLKALNEIHKKTIKKVE
jgi:regulator of protease activity HflC (stomatin/prohibitin superfamily)